MAHFRDNEYFLILKNNVSSDPQTTSSWSTTHNKVPGFPPNTNLSSSIGSTVSKRESVASTSSFSRGDSQVADDDDDDDDEGQDGMGSGPQPGIFDLVQPMGQQVRFCLFNGYYFDLKACLW